MKIIRYLKDSTGFKFIPISAERKILDSL